MNSINYEEDSEDIDFPPVVYSKEIKDESQKRKKKKKNCLNKCSKLFKSKRSFFLFDNRYINNCNYNYNSINC